MTEKNEKSEFTFEIKEHLGVIQKNTTGWCKELNLVSWNGGTPKYDIRDWDSEHKHMSRGITLHKEEIINLMEILEKLDIKE